MSGPRTDQRFGILAHVGNGNLGDEATVAAVLQNIRLRRPGAEIVVFSANPPDTAHRHGVVTFPIRRVVLQAYHPASPDDGPGVASGTSRRQGMALRLKAWLKSLPWLWHSLSRAHRAARILADLPQEVSFLYRSFRSLQAIDRLIIAGGGQVGDYFGGPWGYPFALFRWCAVARAAGTRVAFLSVGAEPIGSPISRWFLRRALTLADYRSFRDEGSYRLLEAIGVSSDCSVCPDLVHGLRLPTAARMPSVGPGLTVGINPVPFFDARYWTERDDAIYRRYVETVAAFASWLLERGHRIVFFPTQVRADPPVIHDIELAMKRTATAWDEDRVLVPPVTDFADLTAALTLADVVVASRFHGIVFSFLLDTPVLGLSYYRKTEELMGDMGQKDYVLSIRQMDFPSMVARFTHLETRLATARDQIRRRRVEHQHVLNEQYTRLLNGTSSPGD